MHLVGYASWVNTQRRSSIVGPRQFMFNTGPHTPLHLEKRNPVLSRGHFGFSPITCTICGDSKTFSLIRIFLTALSISLTASSSSSLLPRLWSVRKQKKSRTYWNYPLSPPRAPWSHEGFSPKWPYTHTHTHTQTENPKTETVSRNLVVPEDGEFCTVFLLLLLLFNETNNDTAPCYNNSNTLNSMTKPPT